MGPDREHTSWPLVVGVTGASGVVYAQRLVRFLLETGHPVHLSVSAAGRMVIKEELRLPPGEDPWGRRNRERLRIFPEKDFFAPFCSGSFRFRAVALVPASMGSVGAIANGVCLNNIHRAADVALKERRRLVVVPRETPLTAIHLENLLRLARAGAVILPPSPAFYPLPANLDDSIDFVVSRILDALDIENSLFPRWREGEEHGTEGTEGSTRTGP
jgi:4-hydroxy-3-polyprenylbenzoate decarboxylase